MLDFLSEPTPLPPANGRARALAIRRAALCLDMLAVLVTPASRPFFPAAQRATWTVSHGDAGENQHIFISAPGDTECIAISFDPVTNQWGLWPADEGPCLLALADLTHLVAFAIAQAQHTPVVA